MKTITMDYEEYLKLVKDSAENTDIINPFDSGYVTCLKASREIVKELLNIIPPMYKNDPRITKAKNWVEE
jgi:hypothetical protein